METRQTIFTASRIRPLTFVEIGNWAATLRSKVRKQILRPQTVHMMTHSSPISAASLSSP